MCIGDSTRTIVITNNNYNNSNDNNNITNSVVVIVLKLILLEPSFPIGSPTPLRTLTFICTFTLFRIGGFDRRVSAY